ncbi:putative transcriptional regulator [Desulfamplus magnetovallimortis]|uniref:Putative transcriptional regulator n=1 Tax=Desulfamplus magnetovallimortis TaxID=1246637 RepID=A0A1W1H547_9BACT|nr:helix-turn-helix transcriptional regulator [Desulfamplus magnetovallimortis]SLM27574.1 putative transcriptional regulator [Desulfamplus magnetovallimortis]
MSIEFKAGSISDFFSSAKETAKEIDQGKKVTKKNIIWVEPAELMAILKPERVKIVQYLRSKRKVFFSELASDMQRSPVSLNNDLKILSKYQLIHVFKESNPGHGVHRIIEPAFGEGKIEFKAEL